MDNFNNFSEDLVFASGSNKKFPKDLKKAIKKQMKQKAEGKEMAEMVHLIFCIHH